MARPLTHRKGRVKAGKAASPSRRLHGARFEGARSRHGDERFEIPRAERAADVRTDAAKKTDNPH